MAIFSVMDEQPTEEGQEAQNREQELGHVELTPSSPSSPLEGDPPAPAAESSEVEPPLATSDPLHPPVPTDPALPETPADPARSLECIKYLIRQQVLAEIFPKRKQGQSIRFDSEAAKYVIVVDDETSVTKQEDYDASSSSFAISVASEKRTEVEARRPSGGGKGMTAVASGGDHKQLLHGKIRLRKCTPPRDKEDTAADEQNNNERAIVVCRHEEDTPSSELESETCSIEVSQCEGEEDSASDEVDQDDSFDYESLCSICLDHIEEKDSKVSGMCPHTYHCDCLMEWVKRDKHDNCPICRKQLWDPQVYKNIEKSVANRLGFETAEEAAASMDDLEELPGLFAMRYLTQALSMVFCTLILLYIAAPTFLPSVFIGSGRWF